MLSVRELSVWYGNQQILFEVSLEVEAGRCVAVVGSNGAGKTTLARALAGVGGRSEGKALLGDIDLLRLHGHEVARAGLGLVPERGGLFGRMTVWENMQLSAEFAGRHEDGVQERIDWCLEIFPRLGERRRQRAATLSGGERRMLLFARAIVSGAELLVLDEPSIGLMPSLTTQLLTQVVPQLTERGLAVLLIEQNARLALSVAGTACVLERGRIVLRGTGQELLDSPMVQQAYLGV